MNAVIISAKHTIMRNFKIRTIGLLAATMMLLSFISFLNAQPTEDPKTDNKNEVHIQIVSEEYLESPLQVVLVYDSELTSLESGLTYALNTSVTTSSFARGAYSASSMLESALYEEMEQEIPLEEWMLEPFELESASAFSDDIEEDEEEVLLEAWMTDLKVW